MRHISSTYKHHLEACYCLEGEAEITERDRHRIRVISPLRLVCVFNPALTGRGDA